MVPYYLYLVGFAMLLLVANTARGSDFEPVFEWNSVDFTWPSERARDEAIRRKDYIPKNIAVLDVDVYDPMVHNAVCKEKNNSCAKIKKRVFVTTPRVNRGIPATLSVVTESLRDGKNLLKPFPDWVYNREGNCGGFTSVFRTQIDECGRLWVMDTGVVDSFLDKPRRICSPQILVFDLNGGDKLVGRFPVPKSVLEFNSLLISISLDIRNGKCNEAFAYMTDVTAFKMVIFDARKESFHRVVHNTFYPYPERGDFNIAGSTFELMDGLFSIAVGPEENNDRKLFYHSFASFKESWVQSSVVRDRPAFLKNERSFPTAFHTFDNERTSQAGPQTMSKTGVLYFPQMAHNSINCWNTALEYKPENLVTISQNDVTLQFPSGLKIVGNYIYVLSSRLQKYLDGSITDKEINYRVLVGHIPDLIRGSSCERSDWDEYLETEYGNHFGEEGLTSGGQFNYNDIDSNPYSSYEDLSYYMNGSAPLSYYNHIPAVGSGQNLYPIPSNFGKTKKCKTNKDPKCSQKLDYPARKPSKNSLKAGIGHKFSKLKPGKKPIRLPYPEALNSYAPFAPYASSYEDPRLQHDLKPEDAPRNCSISPSEDANTVFYPLDPFLKNALGPEIVVPFNKKAILKPDTLNLSPSRSNFKRGPILFGDDIVSTNHIDADVSLPIPDEEPTSVKLSNGEFKDYTFSEPPIIISAGPPPSLLPRQKTPRFYEYVINHPSKSKIGGNTYRVKEIVRYPFKKYYSKPKYESKRFQVLPTYSRVRFETYHKR